MRQGDENRGGTANMDHEQNCSHDIISNSNVYFLQGSNLRPVAAVHREQLGENEPAVSVELELRQRDICLGNTVASKACSGP